MFVLISEIYALTTLKARKMVKLQILFQNFSVATSTMISKFDLLYNYFINPDFFPIRAISLNSDDEILRRREISSNLNGNKKHRMRTKSAAIYKLQTSRSLFHKNVTVRHGT